MTEVFWITLLCCIGALCNWALVGALYALYLDLFGKRYDYDSDYPMSNWQMALAGPLVWYFELRKRRRKRVLSDEDSEPIPDYGDLMTLEKFKEAVACGGFIDYDGTGRLATKTRMSEIHISPSGVKDFVFPEWATHVVWFNK